MLHLIKIKQCWSKFRVILKQVQDDGNKFRMTTRAVMPEPSCPRMSASPGLLLCCPFPGDPETSSGWWKQVQDDDPSRHTRAVMLTHVSISWRNEEHIHQGILKQVQDDGIKFRMTETSSGWRLSYQEDLKCKPLGFTNALNPAWDKVAPKPECLLPLQGSVAETRSQQFQ